MIQRLYSMYTETESVAAVAMVRIVGKTSKDWSIVYFGMLVVVLVGLPVVLVEKNANDFVENAAGLEGSERRRTTT
jgi:MFS-type transporter involved in bile tolerance (Atg22 family)